jgi:hypothetical protein
LAGCTGGVPSKPVVRRLRAFSWKPRLLLAPLCRTFGREIGYRPCPPAGDDLGWPKEPACNSWHVQASISWEGAIS